MRLYVIICYYTVIFYYMLYVQLLVDVMSHHVHHADHPLCRPCPLCRLGLTKYTHLGTARFEDAPFQCCEWPRMHEKADGPLRFRFLSQEHTAHVSKNRRVRQHGRDVHIATLKTGVGIVLRTTRLFILNSVILYHWCAWTGEGHRSRNWSWRPRGSPVTELELASARVTSHGTGAGEREGHQSRNWSWRSSLY